jgi:ubiquinone/menaquinone biosynthesis C-methylase UbiE
MISFKRRDKPHALFAGMAGVKLGDRVAQIGCAHGGRLAAIAAQVGLSGQAVAVVPDESSAARARKGASEAGVLVEVEVAPSTRLPLADGEFDLAVIDDTGGLFATMRAEDRVATVREVHRILRPGGRVMVISTAPRGGLGALFSRAQSGPPFDAEPSLQADGFRSARTLAEREGLRFVEAIKARQSPSEGR